MSTFFVDSCSDRIMASGGKGYLTRSMSYPKILEGIRRIHKGETYCCNKLQQD